MLDLESRTDAISGRRRANLRGLVVQLIGITLISIMFVATIAVLF